MKPIHRLSNVFPIFLGVLVIGSIWKLFWGSFVMPRVSADGLIAKFAGAALLQWGVLVCLTVLSIAAFL